MRLFLNESNRSSITLERSFEDELQLYRTKFFNDSITDFVLFFYYNCFYLERSTDRFKHRKHLSRSHLDETDRKINNKYIVNECRLGK